MKRYKSANEYYMSLFGHKMYKAALNFAFTCPNRDGTKGYGGCAFCSSSGSGEFAASAELPITLQIDEAIERIRGKTNSETGYIAYFQSFTSTYCSSERLRSALAEAAAHPRIEAVSIATRPDCLPDDILEVLADAASFIPVFVELGLQTSDDDTARSFGRGYDTCEYDDAVMKLHDIGINIITHIIFGLPGESSEMMLDTVRHAVSAGTDGIKFTCLYILKGTRYEDLWRQGIIAILDMEEYFDIVDRALELIPDDVVVHRLTGDGPKSALLAPDWTRNKRKVINYINARFGR